MEASRTLRAQLILMSILLLLVSTGCATVSPPKTDSVASVTDAVKPEPMGWWFARFKIDWPPDTQPQWFVDALIAGEIIAPVIEQNRDRIALWRFHRRAVPDASGHQFSFIFYSTPQAAAQILGSIETAPLGHEMQASGVLLSIHCDLVSEKIPKPNIEDTSDRNWSILLQRSWPSFIMGVSETWLTLLTQVLEAESAGHPASTLEEKLVLYRRVDEAVQNIWRLQGNHAFLHHLNALFQYEPLMIDRNKAMRF